ncbi:hypothetical protein BGZ96_003712 [Linnemannia gamsii]|uniref:CCHC-type domain-containing protein n=1 Tax=Linnemannia gamsii TaxID=64522 RepID=A0ABQ7JIV9_9FUNG|nr:hypothetical protein BGZ96_003712 [Linnemannia gamsii]
MADQLDSLLTGIEPDRQIAIRKFGCNPHYRDNLFNLRRTHRARTRGRTTRRRPYIDPSRQASMPYSDNQEYFTVFHLDLAEWVQHTALNLISDAKSWWRSSGLDIHYPWDTFETDSLAFQTPPNAVAAAREALESLRQGKRSVALCTHEYRRLLHRVPSLDKGTALHQFVKGLEADTSNEHDPNAMDNDNPHIAINNLTNQVNYLSLASNRANNNTLRPPKLTADEKAHLTANKGCFRCRKIGHMASQCRTFPNQSHQHSCQFINIEAVTTSIPQQAIPQPQQGKAISN